MTRTQTAHALALLVPAGLIGGALVSEYGFGLFPCEMCMWQRWPHLVAIALGLLAFVRPLAARGPIIILATIAIAVSGLIGGFHAGVEYGWWEGITTCATTSGGSGDPLADIMNAPLVRCDVAPWSLFGISLAGWNFLLSVGGAILILGLISRSRKGGQP